jgi:hypothetical protein
VKCEESPITWFETPLTGVSCSDILSAVLQCLPVALCRGGPDQAGRERAHGQESHRTSYRSVMVGRRHGRLRRRQKGQIETAINDFSYSGMEHPRSVLRRGRSALVVPACDRMPNMKVRFALLFLISRSLFAQCDDVPISARQAKQSSEVVFQGTIVGFKGSDIDRTVVFQVSRVWKGRVGRTFDMPAIETHGSLCTAFWSGLLVLGNELVVYASRSPIFLKGKYVPIRQKSVLVRQADDISQLGPGHRPK